MFSPQATFALISTFTNVELDFSPGVTFEKWQIVHLAITQDQWSYWTTTGIRATQKKMNRTDFDDIAIIAAFGIALS